jgi:Tfp pilus assembly protein PilF
VILVMYCLLTIQLLVVLAASAQDSGNPEAARVLNEANANYRGMHPERAVLLYREYLSRFPDRADVRVWLGAALLSAGSRNEASSEVERAIALDAKNAKAYVLRGRIIAAAEKWALASAAFDRAIQLDPRDADAWYFAGRASCAEERFKRAIAQFRQVLKLGREQSRVYVNLGSAYDALDQNREAQAAFRRAIDLAHNETVPGEYRPWFAYGVFLFKQQQVPESLAMLTQAFRIAPDVPEVRFELAKVLYQGSQLSEAAGILEGAANPRECRALNLLSRIFRMQGKDADADRELAAWNRCDRDRDR